MIAKTTASTLGSGALGFATLPIRLKFGAQRVGTHNREPWQRSIRRSSSTPHELEVDLDAERFRASLEQRFGHARLLEDLGDTRLRDAERIGELTLRHARLLPRLAHERAELRSSLFLCHEIPYNP